MAACLRDIVVHSINIVSVKGEPRRVTSYYRKSGAQLTVCCTHQAFQIHE